MHTNQAPYRELVHALHGDLPGAELVHSWLEAHGEEADWFRAFGERSGDPIPTVEIEDLWRLYALSRVSDTLLLDFQPRRIPDETWREKTDISLDDYSNFMLSLGLRGASTPRFHPFFHEIVTVVPSASSMSMPTLEGKRWSPFMPVALAQQCRLFQRLAAKVAVQLDAVLHR